jgi:hypothetical protein
LAAIIVQPGPFLAIIAAAALAATLAALASGRGVVVPVVVIELVLGVVIGPHVLGLHVDEFISFFGDLGLAMLFFFAGYEIDWAASAGSRFGWLWSAGRCRWRWPTRSPGCSPSPTWCCRSCTRVRR